MCVQVILGAEKLNRIRKEGHRYGEEVYIVIFKEFSYLEKTNFFEIFHTISGKSFRLRGNSIIAFESTPTGLSQQEKETLIDPSSGISEKSKSVLLSFPTSYLYEIEFSSIAAL